MDLDRVLNPWIQSQPPMQGAMQAPESKTQKKPLKKNVTCNNKQATYQYMRACPSPRGSGGHWPYKNNVPENTRLTKFWSGAHWPFKNNVLEHTGLTKTMAWSHLALQQLWSGTHWPYKHHGIENDGLPKTSCTWKMQIC